MNSHSRKLFLSAASSELGVDRRVLKTTLVGPLLEVKEQSDFINLGGDTLAMLDKYISGCDGVIHLLGYSTGSFPNEVNVRDLLKRLPDLQTKLPFVPDIATQGHRYSFTHWEAYLAIYYGIDLYLFRPGTKTASYSDIEKQQQEQHRLRLESVNRFGKTYNSSDQLCILALQELVNARFAPFLTEEAKRKVIPNNLPLVGSLFKGRDEFLEQLRSVLVNKPTHIAAVTAKQAIHGLGGVGKTRVAVEYAKRYSHEYTALLFITADSEASLRTNLANLCGAMVLNLPEQSAREQEVQVAAAIRWLREYEGWFLIVDNVDTPEAATAAEELLQKLDKGHVVITSRLSNWGGAVQELALDVISEKAAVEMLLERTAGKRKVTPSDDADAAALAKDLGYLPLALEQAGAFIVELGFSFAEYRTDWKKHDDDVLTWHDQHAMKYPRSVATTWETSFARLSANGRGLLNILCWLAPDPIPLAMLEKLTNEENEPPIKLKFGIGDLVKYSFLKWTDDRHTAVVVHRLVQEITEYRLPEAEKLSWLNRSLQMVDDFTVGDPHDVRTWKDVYTPAQPHIRSITHSADQQCIADPTARLMNQLAVYLKTRASYAEAELLMRRALTIDEQSYGKDHPEVATYLNNLAQLLQATNRLGEAEPLMRRALTIDEQSSGPDHPAVASDLNNLAYLLYETNRLAEAEPLFRRALAIDESNYGPDHPDVASDLNNLAELFSATNRYAEAEPLYRRAIKIHEASYGPDHPNVATAINNLAKLLQATNRLAEAEPLYRRAMLIDEQSYGPAHPDVAIDLNNLAQLLLATNRLAEAEPLMRRGVLILELFLVRTGHSHPYHQLFKTNYPIILQELGRSETEIQAALEGIVAEARKRAAVH